jgi:hypothetical protein
MPRQGMGLPRVQHEELNMRDYIYLGTVPSMERCEQAGHDCNYARMHLECRTFKEQVARNHPVPEHLRGLCGYKVHGSQHDLGTYFELVAWYETDSTAASEWAYAAEQHTSHEEFGEYWDDQSRQILGLLPRHGEPV